MWWQTDLYRHQEFQFLLLDAVHCGTESEHQVLNDSHIFVSFTRISLLFGTKFQYSCKGDKMKRENNPIRLPLETWCSLSVPQCAASNKGNWNSWCLHRSPSFGLRTKNDNSNKISPRRLLTDGNFRFSEHDFISLLSIFSQNWK